MEEGGWSEPAGFHLIVLPFADDIRAPPLEKEFRGMVDLLRLISSLCLMFDASLSLSTFQRCSESMGRKIVDQEWF